MKKKILFLIILFLFLIIPKKDLSASVTLGFGGKVKATQVSGVTCEDSGTLVVLSSNLGGLASSVSSVTSSSNSTGQKVSGVISGVYNSIPFFATNLSKKPKVDGWILGKAEININTSICKMKMGDTSIPFPVRKTSNYNISK